VFKQVALLNLVNLGAALLYKPTNDSAKLDFNSLGINVYIVRLHSRFFASRLLLTFWHLASPDMHHQRLCLLTSHDICL